MAVYKSLVLSPLDAGMLYLCLRKFRPEIRSQEQLVAFIVSRFEEDGWKVSNVEPASLRKSLKIDFESPEALEKGDDDWRNVMGVRRQGWGYQPLEGQHGYQSASRAGGGPSWLNMIGPVVGVSAAIGGVAWYFNRNPVVTGAVTAKIQKKQLEALEQQDGGARVPLPSAAAAAAPASPQTAAAEVQAAPTTVPAPPAPASPGSAPASGASAGAAALAPGQAPSHEALEKDLRDAQAAIASAHRNQQAADGAAPPLQARPNVGRGAPREPYQQNLGNQGGPQKEGWIAQKVLEARRWHPDAPVIFMEYKYDLGGPDEITTERWWFNFRDDYIQSESIDVRGPKLMSDHRRVLAGGLLARLEAAKNGGPLGFRKRAQERWLADHAVDIFAIEKMAERMRLEGVGADLTEKPSLGKRPDEALILVKAPWTQLPVATRLEKAQQIWKIWQVLRYPLDQDQVFIRLVNTRGEKVGGSAVLGAAINVNN